MKNYDSNYEEEQYEIELSNNWIITYSDMITIILCFFIIFFTFTAEESSMLYNIKETLTSEVENLSIKLDDLSKENKLLKQEKQSLAAKLFGLTNIETDMAQSREAFIIFLRESGLIKEVDIIESERGLAIRFKDAILFPSASASIAEGGYEVLSKIADKLKEIDNPIVIEGFTDNIPINTIQFPSNWELSVARAISVARYFIDEKSIEERRITVSGFGEHNPIDTNDTPEGRSNNRRIEIIILN